VTERDRDEQRDDAHRVRRIRTHRLDHPPDPGHRRAGALPSVLIDSISRRRDPPPVFDRAHADARRGRSSVSSYRGAYAIADASAARSSRSSRRTRAPAIWVHGSSAARGSATQRGPRAQRSSLGLERVDPACSLATPPPTTASRTRYDAFGTGHRDDSQDGPNRVALLHHALTWTRTSQRSRHDRPARRHVPDGSERWHGRLVSQIERVGWRSDRPRSIDTRFLAERRALITPHAAGALPITRWMAYDTLGRMVLNVDANTSTGYVAPYASPITKALPPRSRRGGTRTTTPAVSSARATHAAAARTTLRRGGPRARRDFSPCAADHAAYSARICEAGTGRSLPSLRQGRPGRGHHSRPGALVRDRRRRVLRPRRVGDRPRVEDGARFDAWPRDPARRGGSRSRRASPAPVALRAAVVRAYCTLRAADRVVERPRARVRRAWPAARAPCARTHEARDREARRRELRRPRHEDRARTPTASSRASRGADAAGHDDGILRATLGAALVRADLRATPPLWAAGRLRTSCRIRRPRSSSSRTATSRTTRPIRRSRSGPPDRERVAGGRAAGVARDEVRRSLSPVAIDYTYPAGVTRGSRRTQPRTAANERSAPRLSFAARRVRQARPLADVEYDVVRQYDAPTKTTPGASTIALSRHHDGRSDDGPTSFGPPWARVGARPARSPPATTRRGTSSRSRESQGVPPCGRGVLAALRVRGTRRGASWRAPLGRASAGARAIRRRPPAGARIFAMPRRRRRARLKTGRTPKRARYRCVFDSSGGSARAVRRRGRPTSSAPVDRGPLAPRERRPPRTRALCIQ